MGILEKILIWTKKLQVCQGSFLPLLENNFLAEIKLCNLSGSAWKINGFLGKNGWHICQKRIPRDKWILLRKLKFLSKKSKTLISFSELQRNKIVFLSSPFRQGCQNWNPRAQRPFWKKFRNKSSFYILFLEFFAKNLNWTHKLRVCQEGILCVQRNISRNIYEEKPKFWAPSEKTLILANRYWQSCQNSFPCVQRNTLRKMNFCRKFINIWIFLTLIKNFWILAKFVAKNSKRSLSVQKSISKKTFSGEKYNLMIFFSDFQRKVWLAKKVFQECLESNIRV